MNKKVLLLFMLLLNNIVVFSQSNLWKKVSLDKLSTIEKFERVSNPKDYLLYNLDFTTLKSQLSLAPFYENNVDSNVILEFPNENGEFESYKIYNVPVMEKGLSDRYPDINSYFGQNIKNPTKNIRFSVTLFGLHVMTLTGGDELFIDTYTKDLQNYIVYKKSSVLTTRQFGCTVFDEEARKIDESANKAPDEIQVADGTFRQYRLALACTIEYSAYHVNAAGLNAGTEAQKKAAVLAAMNVTMTRVNGVFERDMSLRMNIVANNDLIIFITADNFSNNNANSLINESQTVIDGAIGLANYDIGHTFSTGGGGLAQLQSPCGASKARGITGSGAPVGDPYDIDYVAHEMGHQFGATHTFNGTTGSCAGNMEASTSAEPGSGSTIMGYAGICTGQNVQNNSDAYFHYYSIVQMTAFVTAAGNCSANSANANTAPTANAGTDYTIPHSTPFLLIGGGADVNGDAITYNWEQTDTGAMVGNSPSSTATTGALFRSRSSSVSTQRFFPLLSNVLANTSNIWEVLPTVPREMNFGLTVRDNRTPNGGQTNKDDVKVTVANVGPFLVTSPNTNVNYVTGSNQTFTWDVAGTTANGINSTFVDILYDSTGTGAFNTLIAAGVPNDGSQIVTIPNIVSTTNRIMIRGKNHIFYDVNNVGFTTTASSSSFMLTIDNNFSSQNKSVCIGGSASYNINYTALAGFSGTTNFSISGLPTGVTHSFSSNSISANGVVVLTLNTAANTPGGIHEITVTGTSGSIVKTIKFYLVVNFSSQNLISPANLSVAQASPVLFTWEALPNATTYNLQVSSDIEFVSTLFNSDVAGTSISLSGFAQLKNYFWKVTPKNATCTGNPSVVYQFSTGGVPTCATTTNNTAVVIPATASTITSSINIPNTNVNLADINVNLNLSHTYLSDIRVSLTSPNGTTVILFDKQCTSRDNINATFNDAGVAITCLAATPSVTGNVIPIQFLSAFQNVNPQGTWTLTVQDYFDQDGGTLNSWGLELCTVPITPPTCGQITTTWNGTAWSNGLPVKNTAAIIAGNFSSTKSFEACSLTVNTGMNATINAGHTIVVDNAVTVNGTGTLTINNDAALRQVNNVANTGNIIVKRNSVPMVRLDYTAWSSPVAGQKLLAFSPNTLTTRFYQYLFTGTTTATAFQVVPNVATTDFAAAKGYLIRSANDWPTTATTFNGQFTGVPNNGNYTQPIGIGYNLVGNPYPSPISANTFLANNASINTLYFWTHTVAASGGTYPQNNYASYTTLGGTAAAAGGAIPNGTIQTGQGFYIRTNAAGNATFNNAQRVDASVSTQFFKSNEVNNSSSNVSEKHRIWLNLNDESNRYNQILIGYINGATNDVDQAIDGEVLNKDNTMLYNLINNSEYVIQGKGLPFVETDEIDLGLKINTAGTYSISLENVDGLFTNQNIYIKDQVTNTFHDVKQNPYTFTSAEGIYNNRFKVVFTNTVLSNPSFNSDDSVVVYTNQNTIKISGSTDIRSVVVYDVLGRNLYSNENVNSTSLDVESVNTNSQALLVKVTLTSGQTVTKKIIK